MSNRRKAYEVGYKQPPHEGQFRPGTSGNPRGRPKGSGRLARVARKEAARRIAYIEDGVRKEIRIDDAIVRRALISAAKGDYRAIPIALKLLERDEPERTESSQEEIFDSPADHLSIADIVRWIWSMDQPPLEPGKPESTDKADSEVDPEKGKS